MAETIIETQEIPQTQEKPKDPKIVKLLNAWDRMGQLGLATAARTVGDAMLVASFVDTFPGILYVTLEDTGEVLFASGNYEERHNGAWFPLGSIPHGRLVVHWMVPCDTAFLGVWFITDRDGNVISRSANYWQLREGRWHSQKAARPNGETLHIMVKIATD